MDVYTPTLFKAVSRYAAQMRAHRTQIRTERLLNELPASLRKDIGWPDSYPERRLRNSG
jgi:hypothetical protein